MTFCGAFQNGSFQSYHKNESLGLRLLWFFCHCFVIEIIWISWISTIHILTLAFSKTKYLNPYIRHLIRFDLRLANLFFGFFVFFFSDHKVIVIIAHILTEVQHAFTELSWTFRRYIRMFYFLSSSLTEILMKETRS